MAESTRSATLRQLERLFEEGSLSGLTDRQLLERFLDRRDERAFAAIIERHGTMVLGVCRAILRNRAEVEDAFQATFLILIRKAATIQGRDTIGGWLHRVASRVAFQAVSEHGRRKALVQKAGELAVVTAGSEFPDDLRGLLHEEIHRLPEKLRLALVLCDLEGLARADAAQRLGWTEGELRGRLSRARSKLRERLTRHGLAVTLTALTEALARDASASVPSAWADAITKIASASSTTGKLVASGAISASAMKLARSASTSLLIAKLQGFAAVGSIILAIGLIAPHTIPIGYAQAGDQTVKEKAEPTGKQAAGPVPALEPVPKAAPITPKDRTQSYVFSGTVLGPDGKPFAGAKITLEGPGLKSPENPPARATSGADGRFKFDVPTSEFVLRTGWKIPFNISVIARASGLAPGISRYQGPFQELTLRVAPDDLPIEGRVVDHERKPVSGVTISVRNIRATEKGDLSPWLNRFDSRKSLSSLDRSTLPIIVFQGTTPFVPPNTTDQDGRFRISGIGRERIAELQVEGPTIETRFIRVAVRSGPPIKLSSDHESNPERFLSGSSTVFGASFTLEALPSRPIEGIVKDRETGKPLAGIAVRSEYPVLNLSEFATVTTNAMGRYRLTGLPMDKPMTLMATAPCDRIRTFMGREPQSLPDESLPYLRAAKAFPGADPNSSEPIIMNFDLQRGIWVSGRVLDKVSGLPVQARVSYAAYRENPTLKQVGAETLLGGEYGQDTMEDGAFRLAVLPGPGLIAAKTAGSNYYAMGVWTESIAQRIESRKNQPFGIPATPHSFQPDVYNVMTEVNPKASDRSISVDLLLDQGIVLSVNTLDSDGNPREADAVSGLDDRQFWNTDFGPPRHNFSVMKIVPGKKRIITARNSSKALIGQVEVDGKEKSTPRITLVPWGEITGRLVATDGKPFPEEVQIINQWSNLETPAPWLMRVRKDGTFRIEGLVPGRSYFFFVSSRGGNILGSFPQEHIVKTGEVKDLGDVVVKPKVLGNFGPKFKR